MCVLVFLPLVQGVDLAFFLSHSIIIAIQNYVVMFVEYHYSHMSILTYFKDLASQELKISPILSTMVRDGIQFYVMILSNKLKFSNTIWSLADGIYSNINREHNHRPYYSSE